MGEEREKGGEGEKGEEEGGVVVVVVVVEGEGGKGEGGGEKMCRICHLGKEGSEVSSDLVEIGCACKDDLAFAHRNCSEAWFKIKGSRLCEICGSEAKNVTGLENRQFLEDWSERSRRAAAGDGVDRRSRYRCWRGQPLCNFLMTCLVISFILPWFFRINVF
ncbi:uncharacterized protein LOC144703390 [Wolffia australiana]